MHVYLYKISIWAKNGKPAKSKMAALTDFVKNIEPHVSRLILHLELQYVLLTDRKVVVSITTNMLNLTLTFRIKVIQPKHHLSRLILHLGLHCVIGR